MSGMKKNKKTYQLNAFNIHVSDDNMVIETRAKDWRLTVANTTREYFMLSYLIADSYMDSVELYCQTLQIARLIFSDATLIKDIMAISNKYFPSNETTSVITLDPKVEQEIMGAVKQTEQWAYLALDPETTKKIIDSVETEVSKLESLGKNAIIITSPIVRMYFKKLTEDYFKDLIVVSYNEVESNVELQSVGMVTI